MDKQTAVIEAFKTYPLGRCDICNIKTERFQILSDSQKSEVIFNSTKNKYEIQVKFSFLCPDCFLKQITSLIKSENENLKKQITEKNNEIILLEYNIKNLIQKLAEKKEIVHDFNPQQVQQFIQKMIQFKAELNKVVSNRVQMLELVTLSEFQDQILGLCPQKVINCIVNETFKETKEHISREIENCTLQNNQIENFKSEFTYYYKKLIDEGTLDKESFEKLIQNSYSKVKLEDKKELLIKFKCIESDIYMA